MTALFAASHPCVPFSSPEMKSGKGGKLSLLSECQIADSYKN